MRARRYRLLRRIGFCLLGLVLLLASGWAIAALYIDLLGRWRLPGVFIFVSLLFIGLILRPWPLKVITWISMFLVVLVWWLNLEPSNDRVWQSDVSRTAWVEMNSNLVTIHNVRNFDYRTEFDYFPDWEQKTVDLNQIQALDLFITYWGSPWIAHPIVSFQFADGQHIAISVEVRKEMGESYSSFRGFFRQYELIYIVAEERDVIRLRTNYRTGEEVYLYRSTATPEQARAIFVDYLATVNKLHEAPAFYNALTSNCTTNIRLHTGAAAPASLPPWDWRLLLNGKSDEFSYQYGRLAGNLPFAELKSQAHINEAARAADTSPDFSSKIRVGRAGFAQ